MATFYGVSLGFPFCYFAFMNDSCLQQNIFQAGLKPGGLFILKENIARSGTYFIFHTLLSVMMNLWLDLII